MSLLSSGCKFSLAVQVLATKWCFHQKTRPASLLHPWCPPAPAVPWVGNAGGCYSGTFRHSFFAQGWQGKGTVSPSLIDVVTASAPNQPQTFTSHCPRPLTPPPHLPDASPTSPLQACWCGSMLSYANFGSMQIAYGMQIKALNN